MKKLMNIEKRTAVVCLTSPWSFAFRVANNENFRANIFTAATCNNTFLKPPLINTWLNCFAECLRSDIDLPLTDDYLKLHQKQQNRFLITIIQVRSWLGTLNSNLPHVDSTWSACKEILCRKFHFALFSKKFEKGVCLI